MNICRTDSPSYHDQNDVNTPQEDQEADDLRQAQIDGFFNNFDLKNKRFYESLQDILDTNAINISVRSLISIAIQENKIASLTLLHDIKKAVTKYAEDLIDQRDIFWDYD